MLYKSTLPAGPLESFLALLFGGSLGKYPFENCLGEHETDAEVGRFRD